MSLARTGSWLALAFSLAACGEDPPAPPEERPAPERAEVRPRDTDEQPSAHEPAANDAVAAVPRPESGCAFGAPLRVHDAPGWVSVAASEGAFIVAGAARHGTGEEVFVSRVGADGTVRELAHGALENGAPDHRRAAPAIATSGSRVALALADGRARLVHGELEGGSLEWHALAEGASLRFTPALAARGDGWTIAWTEEREHTMRVRAGSIAAGELSAARELRPEGGGSAAPSFVAGASPPLLVFLDPRAGVSVVHRSAVERGAFHDPEVARPINLVTEPPEIVAVRAGGAPWLAYTAVGSAATTAVGLVPLASDAPPVALVPGSGYGVLHVDAAALPGDRAVFVADAPRGSAPDSPRELHVRVLSSDGVLGDPTIVRGPDGAAARGRIAHLADGVVALAFTDARASYAAVGRCAAAR